LRQVFERARRTIPSILFLDELDALVGKRSNNKADPIQQRILATMLMEMDGVSSANGLIVVAATNRPDLIDEALRRPGRFDRTLYVPPPRTLEECAQVFDLYTKNMPLSGVDRGEVRTVVSRRALELELTGAEIRAVCVRAGISALRRSANEVLLSDFMDSFRGGDEKEKSSGRFKWWEKFSRGSHG
jgi:SpoVK/Ycf46/Vps4 family AAA+-type ATPase